MAAHQSPFDGSETASCSTPGYPAESRKRKRSVSGPQPAREYGLMRDSGEHDVARFVGSSSGIHYIRAVYLRLARRSASRATQGTATSNLVPGEDDQLREANPSNRDQVLWEAHEASDSGGQDVKPSFEDLIEWSKSYFESWHPVLPFLHGPDILRSFEDVSNRGLSKIHPLDLVIIKSVLSISLADSRQSSHPTKAIPLALLFESYDAAVASSQFALGQPASIRATQAAISIQLFLTSMLCLNAASRLGGLIVRMAFHLGLHRCPTRFPFFTPEVASLRRRVFWCIYTLERLLCQSLGLPLDIQDDDLDVCYPGEERHSESREGTRDEGESHRLQMLTFVAKHARIRGLILELRNKAVMKRQDTVERTAFVQTELAKWANEIQDVIEEVDIADSPDDVEVSANQSISSSHRLMLRTLKYESMISLNRPGLAAESPTTSYSSAFQACISAAKSICSLMRRHGRRHRLTNDPNENKLTMPLLWPSFTWTVWISTFVLVHAAFENQTPMKSAIKHAMAAKSALGHVAARGTSWPEYCLEAIDELISAVQEMSHHRYPAQHPSSTLPAPPDASTRLGSIQGNRSHPIGHRPSESTVRRVPTAEQSSSANNSVVGTQPGEPPSASSGPTPRRHVAPAGTSEQRQTEGDPELLAPQPLEIPAPGQPFYEQGSMGTPASQGIVEPITADGRVGLPNNTGFSYTSMLYQPPLESVTEVGSVEGQESMKWYDQLFSSSFSAIDNPFLVAAEFDASIDPTWHYLRVHGMFIANETTAGLFQGPLGRPCVVNFVDENSGTLTPGSADNTTVLPNIAAAAFEDITILPASEVKAHVMTNAGIGKLNGAVLRLSQASVNPVPNGGDYNRGSGRQRHGKPAHY